MNELSPLIDTGHSVGIEEHKAWCADFEAGTIHPCDDRWLEAANADDYAYVANDGLYPYSLGAQPDYEGDVAKGWAAQYDAEGEDGFLHRVCEEKELLEIEAEIQRYIRDREMRKKLFDHLPLSNYIPPIAFNNVTNLRLSAIIFGYYDRLKTKSRSAISDYINELYKSHDGELEDIIRKSRIAASQRRANVVRKKNRKRNKAQRKARKS